MSPGALVALVALLALATLVGCDGGDGGGEAEGPSERLEPSGALALALAERPRQLDPLRARTRAERLVSRQIHEPLLATETGPFGATRSRRGLTRELASSARETIWTLRLRHGVRFQDGSLLDADAVLANVDRWGDAGLLDDLVAADAPRPDRVRLFLSRPAPELPELLASAQLGLISPDAIEELGGPGSALPGGSGTGPFELREDEADWLLLARNTDWWGTPLGLGPGVDRLELPILDSAAERVDALAGGTVEVADEIDAGELAEVRMDPLLTSIAGAETAIAFERSVRGIDSASAEQSLADVWVTTLGP